MGKPSSGGSALMMTSTAFGLYDLIRSLMAISLRCRRGPVWYQPTIFSLAEIETNKMISTLVALMPENISSIQLFAYHLLS